MRLHHLDQIAVRIAKVDRNNRPLGAGALDRPADHVDLAGAQVRQDVVDRQLGEKTKIGRAWRRRRGSQVDRARMRVQVDLLTAKVQRGATLAKGFAAHAEHRFIEYAGPLDIAYRKDQVIEAGNCQASYATVRQPA